MVDKVNWDTAWAELYKYFGETMNQEALDIMDSVLQGVIDDDQDQNRQRRDSQTVREEKS